MKTLILLFSVLFTTMSFAQVPNYVPANGLVGWWPFNGNANDESGNGNNGTVNGAILTADRNGVANQAYSFDGIDDFISILRNYQGSFTTSIWFNSNGNSQYKPLIDAFDVNWEIQIINSFLAYVSFDNSSNIQVFNSSILITNNNWNNLICTFNSNLLNFYLNGNQIDQFTVNTLPINSGNYFLGASLTGSAQYFEGKLDDIGIWNRALTACEIQNLYTSTNPINTTTTASCNSFTWNGQTYTQSGVYTGTTTNCVTESLNLTINSSTSSTQNQTALDTYTWPINNQTYTQGGTYTATIPNAAGCDSVVTLNLTLNYTGINELNGSAVNISPNPTSSKITVKASLVLIGKEYIIYDQQGKVVKSGIITAEETEIDLSNLSEGVYLFKAGAEMQETFKIIKQ
jgi:hypothetical protein